MASAPESLPNTVLHSSHIPTKENLSESTIKIITHPDRLIFNFSSLLKKKINGSFNNYDHFYKSFYIDQNDKKSFINSIEEKNIEIILKEINSDWIYIENRIKAEIASSLWGKEFLFKTNLKMDDQVLESYNYFNEATKLLKDN